MTTHTTSNAGPFVAQNNNMQPFLGLNYALVNFGTFPERTGSSFADGTFLGEVVMYAGNYTIGAPTNGQLIPINQNQALFSLLGSNYGGDGQVFFGAPDLRGRTPIGAGAGSGLTIRALGDVLGSEQTVLTYPEHNHTITTTGDTTDNVSVAIAGSNMQPSLALNYIIALDGAFPSPNGILDGIDIAYTGEIALIAGNFAPAGWAFADGRLLQISDYPNLFNIIGSAYGGDGETTFALPNLQGRTAVGAVDTTNPSPLFLGQTGGTETVSGSPSHSHTINGDTTTSTNAAPVPYNNYQPYSSINYIISLAGLFADNEGLVPDTQFLGEIRMFAGHTAPGGWALANGQLLPISQQAPLFSRVGTAFGGDGNQFFALPDLRGRVPIGVGAGTGLTPRIQGGQGGTATESLAWPDHTHAVPLNSPPVITSNATVSLPEGFTVVIDIATLDDADTEGNGLTYSITGGADQSLFSLDANTGGLSFISTPDFEIPVDANGNNVYEVEVSVTDSGGLTANQALSISITDVEEPPLVNGQPATIFVNASGIVVGNAYQAGQVYSGSLFSNTDGTVNPDDIVLGTQGDDNIWTGSQGVDQIEAGDGDDVIGFGDGGSTVWAGDGDDFVYAVGPTTNILGNIFLGAGDDNFWAADGNYYIAGGPGNDLIGLGPNTFTFVETGEGDDFIYSFNGGGGNHTFDLGEGNNIVWLEGGNSNITTGSGNDSIGLGTGTDTVNAGDGNNIVYMVNPALPAGNKNVFTGSGDDYIETGSGNDLLSGGAGLNTLKGGTGLDTFVARSDAYNYISDFGVGSDRIQLSGLTLANLSFFQGTGSTAADTFIFQGSNLLVQVANTNVNVLNNAANFV